MGAFTFVSAATSSDKASVWPTVWAALAALVALGALLRSLMAYPSRRLIYVKEKPSSLANAKLDNDDPASRRLQTMAKDLPNARIIKVILAGRGRRDITSECFAHDEPIKVELGGATILGVVQQSSPEWYRAPTANTDGQCLKIGPGFISKKQRLAYFLLVNEEQPKATLQASLTDVVVAPRSNYTGELKPTVLWYGYWLLVLGYLAFVGVLLADYVWHIDPWLSAYPATLAVLLVAAILAGVGGKQSIKREGATSDVLLPATVGGTGPPAPQPATPPVEHKTAVDHPQPAPS